MLAKGVRQSGPSQANSVSAGSVAKVPLVAHVIYRFDVGGLENGLVNLINAMPASRFRHAIVCLTEHTEFRRRIRRDDVSYHALHKQPGKDFGVYWRLWRLLRELKPNIVHTRNLAALDSQLVAAAAGVRARVHGEHGRDVYDLHGRSTKYVWMRRCLRPFVHRYIPLSCDLENWLMQDIHVARSKVSRIYNGVDSQLFHPPRAGRDALPVAGFAGPEDIVIGTIGRMEPVKDPLNLVRAFVALRTALPDLRDRLRLVMVGEGSLRTEALELLQRNGIAKQAWLPGSRDDVASLLRGFDIFVLPSLAEGISNTVLEAMASGLPVVATRVGGNPELIGEHQTGALAPAADADALAQALTPYAGDAALRRRHGHAGRVRIERDFSMAAMVEAYMAVYDRVLSGH